MDVGEEGRRNTSSINWKLLDREETQNMKQTEGTRTCKYLNIRTRG